MPLLFLGSYKLADQILETALALGQLLVEPGVIQG
jgi:hypothetical protein